MTNCMKSTKISLGVCWLILLFSIHIDANSKSSVPVSELSTFKAKYPDNPIITIVQKQDITITPDENGVPVMHIIETCIDMILSETGAEISEGKEYFNRKNVVKKFEAYSLIPDKNRYKKLKVNNMKKITEFGDHLYYDDSYCYSFNFPATGKGVKRWTYSETEVRDPFHPIIFYFAGNIPVDQAEITITMPQDIRINFHLFGGDTTSVQHSLAKRGSLITYRWSSHQPKVTGRDFMAPGFRYLQPHLIAQIASQTAKGDTTRYLGKIEDLYRWLNKKVEGLNDTITPEIEQMTDSVIKGISDQTEKVRAIYKWVQNNIKYIAIEDGENGFVPREASLVLKHRYGDCKDKSSLLTAMIKVAGEKSSLATVGTRELPYKFSEFPSMVCGNHMVAVWWNNGKPMVLDGTSRHNKLEDVPAFIQGKECVIETVGEQFHVYEIPVAEAFRNSQTDTIQLSIDHDMLLGSGHSTIDGEAKSNIIDQLERKEIEKQLEFWPSAIFGASDKLFVTSIKTSDLAEVNSPLNVSFEFKLPDFLTRQDNKAYVNMNIERMLTSLDVKADREIPIEVEFNWEHQIVYQLKIPENMQVNYLPKPMAYNNLKFGFSQNYVQTGKEIILNTRIYSNIFLIEGKDISAFREMLEALKKAYRQTIALSLK
jgi:hypothetical protein